MDSFMAIDSKRAGHIMQILREEKRLLQPLFTLHNNVSVCNISCHDGHTLHTPIQRVGLSNQHLAIPCQKLPKAMSRHYNLLLANLLTMLPV